MFAAKTLQSTDKQSESTNQETTQWRSDKGEEPRKFLKGQDLELEFSSSSEFLYRHTDTAIATVRVLKRYSGSSNNPILQLSSILSLQAIKERITQ